MRLLMIGACVSLLAGAAAAQTYNQDRPAEPSGGYSGQGYGNPDDNQSGQPDQDDNGQYDDGQYDNGRYGNGQYDRGQYGDEDQGSGSYDQDRGGQYDNGQYDNGQYDNGQYDNGRYRNDQYDNGQNDNDRYHRGPYGADRSDRYYDESAGGQGYGYRMSGAHYTGRLGASWRDQDGRYCVYRELTWTGPNGQPAYRWEPSCRY